MTNVPALRINAANAAPVNPDGRYVLYWMIAARRPYHNFGLQRAVELAQAHRCGLLIFEPLRCDYRWASDRLHQFVIQGMAANARAFKGTDAAYHAYVEPKPGAGKGLLAKLAADAVCVVTDEFPCFFLPHMVEAAAARLPVRLEQVDSNGLLPLRAADREFTVAHSFRRWLQKNLRPHMEQPPQHDPLAGVKLPPVDASNLPAGEFDLTRLPIDHEVGPALARGGWDAAAERERWFDTGFRQYAEDRSHPDEDAASGLSPWLHFGHIGVWRVLDWIAAREGWDLSRMTGKTDGRRGWYGMGENGEAFMDELVTWRELGYQQCFRHPEDYAAFESLPAFAVQTLTRHAGDRRPYIYALEQLEAAQTHDEAWNAAQRQLLIEGRMHNYLRMLWGKQILHWTQTPQQALEVLIHLNNKYALDGRNPNSYSGIMWCLGRFDRAWGPERPVFGKVRYMTSASTRRKLRMEDYLARYA
jgi:deoxyribodipyrimidine photo-lyase